MTTQASSASSDSPAPAAPPITPPPAEETAPAGGSPDAAQAAQPAPVATQAAHEPNQAASAATPSLMEKMGARLNWLRENRLMAISAAIIVGLAIFVGLMIDAPGTTVATQVNQPAASSSASPATPNQGSATMPAAPSSQPSKALSARERNDAYCASQIPGDDQEALEKRVAQRTKCSMVPWIRELEARIEALASRLAAQERHSHSRFYLWGAIVVLFVLLVVSRLWPRRPPAPKASAEPSRAPQASTPS